MKKIKVCIIGAGNISNTRHLPALKKIKRAEVIGVVSNKLDRAQKTADKHHINNFALIESDHKAIAKTLNQLDWFKEVDAVVIGAPPHLHYDLVKAALLCDKHVLVEKPMMMNKAECDELIELASLKNRVFYVMHNFQFTPKMMKLNAIIESRKFGDLESITEVQFTNHDRRLPEWYNDLPMGLFYDEAAHFMYLLEHHAGDLVIDKSHAVYDSDPAESTPITLTVDARAGTVPVTMMLNFRSPICEWYYVASFKKRIFVYDFFKDILIDLPTDGEHLAGDIMRNSFLYTFKYWIQFIANGLKMFAGNLLYGHDYVLSDFVNAAGGGAVNEYLVASNGRKNVMSINEIIAKSNKR